jgi:hypothetical protein
MHCDIFQLVELNPRVEGLADFRIGFEGVDLAPVLRQVERVLSAIRPDVDEDGIRYVGDQVLQEEEFLLLVCAEEIDVPVEIILEIPVVAQVIEVEVKGCAHGAFGLPNRRRTAKRTV